MGAAQCLQVLRLLAKMGLRCSNCRARHGKAATVHSTQSLPDLRRPVWRWSACCMPGRMKPEVLRMLHLPRKMNLEVLQLLRVPRKNQAQVLRVLRYSILARLRGSLGGGPPTAPAMQTEPGGAPSVAFAVQNEFKAFQVLRLPRKRGRHPQYSINAKFPQTGGGPHVAPARQNESGGAPSAVPHTN